MVCCFPVRGLWVVWSDRFRKLNNQNSFEILVQGTVDGSPAGKSTLKVGDIIRKIGGKGSPIVAILLMPHFLPNQAL